MSDYRQDAASQTSRLRYQSPQIELIGSIAAITAASTGSGADSVPGYCETVTVPGGGPPS
jgi:hypothetical protein